MSGRSFSKVSPAIWRSGRFTGLECRHQLLLLFYLTSEHQNSSGCFRLPDGYACTDLGWGLADYTAARDKLGEVGLITFDADTHEVFVDRWHKHNPPQNEKHAIGTRRIIERIESDLIREKVEAEFLEAHSRRKVIPLPGMSSALANSRLVRDGFR